MNVVNRKQDVVEGLLYHFTVLTDSVFTTVIPIVQLKDGGIRFIEAIFILKVLLHLLLFQAFFPFMKRNVVIVVPVGISMDISRHDYLDYRPELLQTDLGALLV